MRRGDLNLETLLNVVTRDYPCPECGEVVRGTGLTVARLAGRKETGCQVDGMAGGLHTDAATALSRPASTLPRWASGPFWQPARLTFTAPPNLAIH